MTTQYQDKMRADFEAWAKDRGYQYDELARCKIGIVSPEYFNLNTEMAWQAYQSACVNYAADLTETNARIADLEAQLSAVGAGGVEALRKNSVRYRFSLIESPEWTYAVCKWDGNDWVPINDGEGQSELDAAIAAQSKGEAA